MNRLPTSKTFLTRAAVVAAALGAAAPVLAVTANPLPPEHHQGAVVFRTGGIGEDESMAMKQASGDYSLAVTLVERERDGSAGYLASQRVTISRPHGNAVLDTVTNGPFLLAQLPEGRYTVKAWHGDAAKEQTVTVAPGQTRRVTFSW
jgi:hypothetical protein